MGKDRKTKEILLIELLDEYFDKKDIMKESKYNAFKNVATSLFDKQL